MEDSTNVNGELENQESENFYDADEAKITQLANKIEALQSEKMELSNENKQVKENIKKLTLEFDELRSREEDMRLELGQWEEDSKVMDSMAARALDLETQVTRLQHDLISSMNEVDEVNKEVVDLKRRLEDKDSEIEKLNKEIDELKKEKAESERKERELERKLGVVEVRETEERSKKVRIEEEMREKMDEFRMKVEELEAEVARTKAELQRTEDEKSELEEKVTDMELLMLERRTTEEINGKAREILGSAGYGSEDKGWLKGLNVPVVAAGSAGVVVVAVAAVGYLCCRKPT